MTEMAGLRWRKSTHSNDNGSCVELVALADGSVAVRDSKNPDGGALVLDRGQFRSWLDGARVGEFDI